MAVLEKVMNSTRPTTKAALVLKKDEEKGFESLRENQSVQSCPLHILGSKQSHMHIASNVYGSLMCTLDNVSEITFAMHFLPSIAKRCNKLIVQIPDDVRCAEAVLLLEMFYEDSVIRYGCVKNKKVCDIIGR